MTGKQGKNAVAINRAHAFVSLPPRKAPPGLKPKDLVGIPWRVAFALQADGWYLRSDIIWAKPNPMPESVTDRPTKSHEYLFLLAKSRSYLYDADAIRERSVRRNVFNVGNKNGIGMVTGAGGNQNDAGRANVPIHHNGRNRRTVWTIPTQPFPGAHFAVFPPALVEPCVLAGSRTGDLVLDPFAGAGTVGVVCRKHSRRFVGIEINPEYAEMARGRLGAYTPTDGLWSAA
jgi:DNA modification methylase